jgi:cobalt-zinc-cadmium efflux system membrane fusion protein
MCSMQFLCLAAAGVLATQAAAAAAPLDLQAKTTPVAPPAAAAALPGADPNARIIRIAPDSMPYIRIQAIRPEAVSGTITAPARVDFKAKAVSSAGTVVSGRVTQIDVQIGDRVKAGQPLLHLASAEAAQMRSDLARARVELAQSEYRYQRQEQMKQTGVGLENERMEAEAKLKEDQADFERARDALRLLGDGVAEEVIVRAPMDATVLRAHVSAGSAVAAGASLFDLGEPSSLWIIADVFERDLLLVENGARVSIDLPSRPQPIEGHVVGETAAIEADTRRGQVFIEPDDRKLPLRPGMYARVSIQAASPASIVLPTEAILIRDGKHTIVYVETAPGQFQARRVLVGPAREGMTPVLKGLARGERVVVGGALLIDGEAAMLL